MVTSGSPDGNASGLLGCLGMWGWVGLGDVEHFGAVFAGDEGLFVLGDAFEDAVDDFAGLGEGGLGVGVVGTPLEGLHAHVVAKLDAEVVFLEAEEHVALEVVAGHGAVLVAAGRTCWGVPRRPCPCGSAGRGPRRSRIRRRRCGGRGSLRTDRNKGWR